MKDYYEILNVSKDASEDDIKSSYRELAKKYHPDLNPDDKKAEQKFKEATQAYEVLSNSEKRQQYDMFGEAGVNGQGGYSQGFGGFEDIFEDIFDIFGGSSSRTRKRGPVRGADLRYNLELEFKEAVFGVEKDIQIRKAEECSTCEGSGAEPDSGKKTCSKCNGTGEVKYAQQSAFGQFVRVATCDECDGEGETIENKCHTCNGAGNVMKNKKINVKIPAGVDNDSIISIQGEGEPGERGGSYGDLYIYITVKEDKFFNRKGNNIYYSMPISFTDAALGAEIEVPTLEGAIEHTIPAGTQSETEFRLKNKGVPNVRGMGRGDIYFKVRVQVPEKLTSKQKELLRELDEEFSTTNKKTKKGFFEKVKDALGN